MGFQVPDDLVGSDLTVKQLELIIQIRRRLSKAEKRLGRLPAQRRELGAAIQDLRDEEASIIGDAAPMPEETS